MKQLVPIIIILLLAQNKPQHLPPIVAQNAQAIVYLQVEDAKGGADDTGTGFIVSRDGCVLTVAHLKVDASKREKLTGVIGKRNGPSVSLSFVGSDDEHDLALWQLPKSASLYQAVSLSGDAVSVLDSGIVLGFPLKDDLSASKVSIRNASSVRGFYKSDGYLQHGNSGGPMLNTTGSVVAMVQGGTLPGTEDNDLIPITLAIELTKKYHVEATIRSGQASSCAIPPSPLPLPNSDYETLFKEHQNELDLSKLGVKAFAKRDYLWTIKFLEQAQSIQSAKVWEENFPYLAAARLLANKDHKAFECTLQDMLAAMREPGYLHHSPTVGFALNHLSDVRQYVDPQAQKYIDDVIVPEAREIKKGMV